MTTDAVERFQTLQEQVSKFSSSKERAKGRLEQLLKTLEEKTGCVSLKEAVVQLTKVQREVTVTEKNFQNAMDDFENDWGEVLQNA